MFIMSSVYDVEQCALKVQYYSKIGFTPRFLMTGQSFELENQGKRIIFLNSKKV